MTQTVLESIADGVGIITLNRPEKLNAMTGELQEGLLAAVTRMRDDPDVGCVILTGAGRGFCAGGDVGAVREETKAEASLHPSLRKRPQTATGKVERLARLQGASMILHSMSKPTIAMINGPCAGAGFALAGACDLRFAGASAVFTTAFIKAGIPSDYGGAYFWTKIAGAARARELFLLSEKLDAQTALAQGLVTRVYADDDLSAETLALARGIAAGPRHAYALIKRSLELAEHANMEETLRMDALGMTMSRYDAADLERLARDSERFADQLAPSED
jgi:2-(1,2-epoxy-1,2-dihydrophenyl)acetyl-CoA isomerase